MVEPIVQLKDAYPTCRSEIDGIEASLEALKKLEEVIFEKTQGKVYEATQPILGLLARIYQYTMSFVFICGTQNYNGTNADIRCVAETIALHDDYSSKPGAPTAPGGSSSASACNGR